MNEPNAERLVAIELLGRPKGIEVLSIYGSHTNLSRQRIDKAIAHLEQAGILQRADQGRVKASEAFVLLQDLGLVAI